MVKSFIINTISRGLGFFCKWFVNIIAVKLLLPEAFGEFIFLMSVSYVLSALVSFGLELYCFSRKKEEGDSDAIVTGAILSTLIVSLIATLPLLFLEWKLAVLFLSISVCNLSVIYSKYLGLYHYESYGAISAAIVLLASYIIISSDFLGEVNLGDMVYLSSISFVVISIPSLYLYLKSLSLDCRTSFYSIVDVYRERRDFGFHEVVSVATQHVFVISAALLLGAVEAGTFRYGQLYLVPLMLIPASLSQIVIRQISVSESGNLKRHHYTLAACFSLGLVALCWIIYLGCTSYLWHESNYDIESLSIIFWMYALVLCVQVVNVFWGSALTAIGLQGKRAKASVYAFIMTLMLTPPLLLSFGVVGASLALLLHYVVLFAQNLINYEKSKSLYSRA
ncbi:polysaccharide biosynthesis C-terminal domain-containing protein [Ferrimonas balearica]|nr:polysaccharide biosynthesis C-terminal domain-containing protein [Ferrimonas balearica]